MINAVIINVQNSDRSESIISLYSSRPGDSLADGMTLDRLGQFLNMASSKLYDKHRLASSSRHAGFILNDAVLALSKCFQISAQVIILLFLLFLLTKTKNDRQ